MSDFAKEKDRHKPRRRNKENKAITEAIATGKDIAENYEDDDRPWREPDPKWHATVRYIFLAMQRDVMAQFMTEVGWAQLYLKCEAWSMEFDSKFLGISADGTVHYGEAPIPPAVLADISRTLDSFGGSESARRSMKILVDPNPDGVKAAQAGDARMSARKTIARPARKALGG